MPKRTNAFQKLIALLHQELASVAKVTESKFLLDHETGEEREVDIVIESSVGDYPLVIGIECIDHTRPADVNWVEQISAKHQKMRIGKTILVSRAGFISPL